MATVIQFIHPGKENFSKEMLKKMEKPENRATKTNPHKRNFICADGEYIDAKGKKAKDKLAFWGEWENEANILCHYASAKGAEPKILISPLVPKSKPCNIDPFVFGECFKYFCCHQNGNSRMKKLSRGDLILFGSNLGGGFVLDTVFVVADRIEYTRGNFSKIKKYFEEHISKADFDLFKKSSLASLCDSGCPEDDSDQSLVCYIGATYNNQVNGMYSFSPAMLKSACTNKGFERIKVTSKNLPFISDGLKQNFKANKNVVVKNEWNKIVQLTLKNKCVLGTKFCL